MIANVNELIKGPQCRYYDGTTWLLCFNVKCGYVDVSFDNLVKIAKNHDIDGLRVDDPTWMGNAREACDGLSQDWLRGRGREGAPVRTSSVPAPTRKIRGMRSTRRVTATGASTPKVMRAIPASCSRVAPAAGWS